MFFLRLALLYPTFSSRFFSLFPFFVKEYRVCPWRRDTMYPFTLLDKYDGQMFS